MTNVSVHWNSTVSETVLFQSVQTLRWVLVTLECPIKYVVSLANGKRDSKDLGGTSCIHYPPDP